MSFDHLSTHQSQDLLKKLDELTGLSWTEDNETISTHITLSNEEKKLVTPRAYALTERLNEVFTKAANGSLRSGFKVSKRGFDAVIRVPSTIFHEHATKAFEIAEERVKENTNFSLAFDKQPDTFSTQIVSTTSLL